MAPRPPKSPSTRRRSQQRPRCRTPARGRAGRRAVPRSGRCRGPRLSRRRGPGWRRGLSWEPPCSPRPRMDCEPPVPFLWGRHPPFGHVWVAQPPLGGRRVTIWGTRSCPAPIRTRYAAPDRAPSHHLRSPRPSLHDGPSRTGGRRDGHDASERWWRRPSPQPPQSVVWTSKLAYGTTDHALDGDTVALRADGDGSAVAPLHVRNAGIQAMETGQCHAAAATASMDELTRGKRLRLTTADVTTSSQGRPVRYIDAQSGRRGPTSSSRSSSAGRPFPSRAWATSPVGRPTPRPVSRPPSGARTSSTRTTASRARRSRRPCVSGSTTTATATRPTTPTPSTCASSTAPPPPWLSAAGGSAPPPRTPTRFRRTPWFRQGVFTLLGKHLHPARSLGRRRPQVLQRRPVPQHLQLRCLPLRRDGDLRSWSLCPCLASSADARTGHVASGSTPTPRCRSTNVNGEYVRFAPSGLSSVDLSWTVVSTNGFTYEFPRGTVVRAGETLTLRSGKGTSTRLNHYWGNAGAVLVNAGSGSSCGRRPRSASLPRGARTLLTVALAERHAARPDLGLTSA